MSAARVDGLLALVESDERWVACSTTAVVYRLQLPNL
jgi:hypothetical protein